ncbi:MAG: DUF4315 family protein [Oscillospiraceae bacterium]|nr:DUF4315 family protein [Oscillospiraceae bacterium]
MRNPAKIDRLREDLARAEEKAAEWQARVKDIRRQITEQENLEILQAVRSVAASPEELRGLLAQIAAANQSPIKQEETEHEK